MGPAVAVARASGWRMEDGEGRGYECQRRRVPEVISKVCNSYGDRGDSGMAASHDHQEDEVTDLSCVSSGHIIC